MRRSRSDLLGENRGDELSLAVDVERPLDANENIVGRAQSNRAAPNDAAALRPTTLRIAGRSRSTGAIVSMVSAVPAGDVIARDEVFGIVSPCAATIETTIGVVRFPGRPPIECLSRIGRPAISDRSPTSTIAASGQWSHFRRAAAPHRR